MKQVRAARKYISNTTRAINAAIALERMSFFNQEVLDFQEESRHLQ